MTEGKIIYEGQLMNIFKQRPCSLVTNEFQEEPLILDEVKISFKVPDLIIVDKNIQNIIAIEFKVKKWRAALQQALNHQLWASKSYVALYKTSINNALKEKDIFEEVGIGLISIGNECSVKIKAKESEYISPLYLRLAKEKIMDRINKVVNYEE